MPDPTQLGGFDTSSGQSVQDYIEQQLFGGPISQTAPELSALSDSSQAGNMDYSFYTDPASSSAAYQPPTLDTSISDYYDTLPTIDPSQFDSSDSGAYVNPDGSISMP